MNTSTLLIPKKLVEDLQFSPAVKKHQEVDFLLRADSGYQLRMKFAKEPLAIWYVDGNRSAISNTRNWRRSLDWIRGHRAPFEPQRVLGIFAHQSRIRSQRSGRMERRFYLSYEKPFLWKAYSCSSYFVSFVYFLCPEV